MSRAELIATARDNAAHVKAGTIAQADDVLMVPASKYTDPSRWQLEMDGVFRRLPLMLAVTAELPNPGDYKAMEAAGMPVIINRDRTGEVHAFVNMCSHRGSQLVEQGRGNTNRFTCPYHAWSYNQTGDLVGIFAEQDFGEIDKKCNSLTPLPVQERAGLIWVTLNPKSTLDISEYLCGYDDLLANWGFENWHFFDSRVVKGPNWKIAYDGYLDLYHLPILHKDTFGSDFPHRAIFYGWGPHQRAMGPDPSLLKLLEKPEEEWPTQSLLSGVWTIFPHISIASFDGGGRGVMLSQLFPGDTPDESITVQNYLMEKPPASEEIAAAAQEQFKFLEYVVQEEDYATGLKQQRALKTGAKPEVMFGRNEEGGQNFHRWLDEILAASDEELPALFNKR